MDYLKCRRRFVSTKNEIITATRWSGLKLGLMKPVFIYRSFIVESFKKEKAFTSNTFILKFEDGSEKFVNSKKWVNVNLLRSFELEATIKEPYYEYLSKDTCCLYYKEW